MSELERLNEVLRAAFLKIGIYKKADMANFLGYKSPYFSGIINGKEKLTEQFLKNISDKLEVDVEWIISGKGEMLKNNSLGETADGGIILTGKLIPFFDAEAAAGTEYGMSMESARPTGMIEIGGFLKDSESALRVYGNSMIPHYPPGCIVGTKLWSERFIEPGEVYVIETDENRFLKRLYYSIDKSAVRCLSDNTMKHENGPAAGEYYYPEFEIPLESIRRLHRVVGVIKRNIL